MCTPQLLHTLQEIYQLFFINLLHIFIYLTFSTIFLDAFKEQLREPCWIKQITFFKIFC